VGVTSVSVVVKKSYESKAARTVTFLVDSGAVYSVVQGALLRKLRIRPHRTRAFHLADGQQIERKIGDAYFEYEGVGGSAPVIFGEPGDANLLGVATLEALELALDPFKRELRPMTLSLMGAPLGSR
jgi:predicted aspartyl protease